MSGTEAPWIDWAGGECPVPAKTLVEVRLRGAVINLEAEPAGYWAAVPGDDTPNGIDHWHHRGTANDIIAYRVVQP